MDCVWMLTVIFGFACLLDRGHSQCINTFPDATCDAKAAEGECWLDSFLPCSCKKSCKTSLDCPGSSQDYDCMCFHQISQCDSPTHRALCPASCDRRNTTVCDPLLSVPHASPSISIPLYGDKVTYTCDPGYNQTGGENGLRACTLDGSWVVSSKTGIPLICEAIVPTSGCTCRRIRSAKRTSPPAR